MNLRCEHLVIFVADLDAMKEFYIDKLGLTLLESEGHFFAAKAGNMRLSFFSGSKVYPPNKDSISMSMILRTDNIEGTRDFAVAKGIKIVENIKEAAGFMKHFSVEDPDGNIVYFGEYLNEPM